MDDWRNSLKSLLPDDYQPEPEPQSQPAPAAKPLLRIEVDRKRAGKIATIIYGFEPDDPACDQLAATLKKRLATGGSARNGEILIQGDRSAQAAKILNELGYKTKKC